MLGKISRPGSQPQRGPKLIFSRTVIHGNKA
jgi:hypothetical protein